MASKAPSTRGRLAPMRNQDATCAFVLDQLSGLRGVRAQSMFGGVGLYADEVFFGILAANVLYFKVDDTTRASYEAAGSKPFKPYAERPMTMPYFSVPAGVIETASTLVRWARQAVAVAMASKKASTKAARRPSKRSASTRTRRTRA